MHIKEVFGKAKDYVKQFYGRHSNLIKLGVIGGTFYGIMYNIFYFTGHNEMIFNPNTFTSLIGVTSYSIGSFFDHVTTRMVLNVNKNFRKKYGKDSIKEESIAFYRVTEYKHLLIALPVEIIIGIFSYNNPTIGLTVLFLRGLGSINNYKLAKEISASLKENIQ